MRFDRTRFFGSYRTAFGGLKQAQVDALEFLLGAIEADPGWERIEEVAYVLSTAQHETASTFRPIKEYRARIGTRARRLQDAYWGTGFYGRGFVQLTHKANYARAGEEFGLDMVGNPDLALQPDTAYKVLSVGMREGWFTKRKLRDFINDRHVDYYEARTIVNGHDKALQIADNAEKFEHVLKAALVTDSVTEPVKVGAKPASTDDGTQTNTPVSGAINEPAAKEVKMSSMSQSSKTITWTMISSAILLALKEAWASAKTETISASKYAIEHLPQTLLILGLAALGVFVYNAAMKRKDQRTNKIIDITADKSKNDVVIT